LIFALSGDAVAFTLIHHMTAKPALFMPLSSWLLAFSVKLACPIFGASEKFFLACKSYPYDAFETVRLAP
jgi:hypothetical protein